MSDPTDMVFSHELAEVVALPVNTDRGRLPSPFLSGVPAPEPPLAQDDEGEPDDAVRAPGP
jgi:hypothetical protein